ncbi:MAG: sulfite exporter TauE/SafE family protein [Actinomycetota bacterium]|nr:sulfite exporter TauE/SafE family protein [Actinomycetota bacterium]
MINKKQYGFLLISSLIFLAALFASHPALAASGNHSANVASTTPWWIWPLVLFLVTFTMGIVAIPAGVGGGVLFVPIVSSFFPFNLDFVRGAGLMIALSGSLAAGPGLLKRGLADLRLAMPVALIASVCSILGAMVGLAIPQNLVQIGLGAAILGIVVVMLTAKKSEYPEVRKPDALSIALRLSGIYHESSTNQNISWQIHRAPAGFVLFILIGFMAGMFGLGAGWANVPVLNLVMGAPLKLSVATSSFLLSITDTSAAWIYINKGAILPMVVAPSIVGMMLGAFVGAKVLAKAKPSRIRYIVITMLFLSGLRALLKGFGV